MMNLQKNRSQISRVNNAQSQIFENQIIMACMGYVMKNSKGKANAQDVLEKIKSMIS